ncbi:MAG: hypothetical protein ACF8R9_00615 [Phycisphaerales bacterium JB054]
MPSTTFWVIMAVVVADLIFVPLVISVLVRGGWNPIAARFPAREPRPDAVTKHFQSYKVGLLNLGFMVHTSVDDMWLHLRPVWFGRRIGMKGASVPWEEIEPVRRRGRRYAEVKIGLATVLGPRWALELAFVDHEDASTPAATDDA